MPRGYANNPKQARCPVCGVIFSQAHHSHKYCGRACKKAANRTAGADTTDRQYDRVSGNWGRYYNRLRCQKGRQELQLCDILALHAAQGGKCALSGVDMTCTLRRGAITRTNASIDRIDPGAGYTIDNIQLVCVALNKLRVDMDTQELIDWCRKVANHALCEQKKAVS